MGHSGAEIIYLDETKVIKSGSERVGDQGAWLWGHPHSNIVRVFSAWKNGYVMERLHEVAQPWNQQPETTVGMLEIGVWTHRPVAPLDVGTLIAYGRSRAKTFWPEIEHLLVGMFESLRYKTLTVGLTHGDPTHENILGKNQGFVLVDPIPSMPRSPDVIANDLGKILQSECGWERILAGHKSVPEPRTDFLNAFSRGDQEAARIFAVYHVLRTLPYLKLDQQDIVRRVVGGNALRL